MKFNEIITLLNEFDYRKNGLDLTLDFLEYMKTEVARLIYKKNLKKWKKRKLTNNQFKHKYNVEEDGKITNYKHEEFKEEQEWFNEKGDQKNEI